MSEIIEITKRAQEELRDALRECAYGNCGNAADAVRRALGEVASLAAKVRELTEERDEFKRELQVRVAAKQKAFSAFGHAKDEPLCACPYCRRDAEDLAEMCAEYEMKMHAAQDDAQENWQSVKRLTAEKLSAESRVHALEQERDEALALASGSEGCGPSSLRDLVAWFHERGAKLAALEGSK